MREVCKSSINGVKCGGDYDTTSVLLIGELASIHEKAAARAFLAQPIMCYHREVGLDYIIKEHLYAIILDTH